MKQNKRLPYLAFKNIDIILTFSLNDIINTSLYSFAFFLGKSKDCAKGFIIGGSLGGVFILIILSGGSAIFIYLQMNQKKQQTAEQNDHYVHHICSTNEHHYHDISDQNKGAVKAIERAEYMELPDTIYTNDDGQ